MKKHINDRPLSLAGIKINDKTPSSNLDQSLHFSFKHFCLEHEKFSIADRTTQYFLKVLERLKKISSLSVRDFVCTESKALRSHKIDWKKTSEPEGFLCLNEQLRDYPPYQFEISSNKHGRVHGFLVNNIFYVVWFDPDHKLYSSNKH